MLKNNIKTIFFFFIVQPISILLLNDNNSQIIISKTVYQNSYKLIIFSSIIYICFGFTLKIQNNKMNDFKSVLAIGLINSICLLLMSIFYNNYVIPNYIQSTPDSNLFIDNFISILQLLNTSETWIIGLPFFKNVNKFSIILGGLHPTMMFFFSIECKKFILKKLKQCT